MEETKTRVEESTAFKKEESKATTVKVNMKPEKSIPLSQPTVIKKKESIKIEENTPFIDFEFDEEDYEQISNDFLDNGRSTESKILR